MNPTDSLQKTLAKIDTNALIGEFIADAVSLNTTATGCAKIALWSNALRHADAGNVALPFLAEMQRGSHDVAALLALSLYVPAAASMRAVAETTLYYTYFRQHPAELITLVTDPDYYISKPEVFDFHKKHTLSYRRAATNFGFPGSFNKWYSRLSAIVHGQLPGSWGKRMGLADTKHEAKILLKAVAEFAHGVELVHFYLLLTVGSELWGRFHQDAKKELLKGISAERCELLGLDGK